MDQSVAGESLFYKLVKQLIDEHEHQLKEAQAENKFLVEKLAAVEQNFSSENASSVKEGIVAQENASTIIVPPQVVCTAKACEKRDTHLADPTQASEKRDTHLANDLDNILPNLLQNKSSSATTTATLDVSLTPSSFMPICLPLNQLEEFEFGRFKDQLVYWMSRSSSRREARYLRQMCFKEWQKFRRMCETVRTTKTFTVHSQLIPPETGPRIVGATSSNMMAPDRFERSGTIVIIPSSGLCKHVLISPTGNLRIAWDLIGTCFLAYDAIMIPLSFFIGSERGSFLSGMDWVTLLFWTLDMVMSCLTGVMQKGKVYMDPARIIRTYLKTWFILDVVVVVPDWVVIIIKMLRLTDDSQDSGGATRTGRLLRSVRFARTFRVLRLAKLRRILQMLHDRIDSEFTFVIIGLVKNMIALIMLNHFLAAVWWAIGSEGAKPNWIDSYDLEGRSVLYRYLTALHWTFCMFTPGSMHVQPVNEGERCFALFILISGMVVFTNFISSMTAAVQQLKRIQGDSVKHLWMLRRFLRQKGINARSPDLSLRVIWYVENSLRKQNARKTEEDHVAALGMLTKQLRAEVRFEASFYCLNAHPLLRRLWTDSKVAVLHLVGAEAFVQQALARTDVLFNSHGSATHMHIVVSGSLQYTKALNARCETLSDLLSYAVEGDWFCEPVLWTSWTCLGVACAAAHTELVSIKYEEFLQIVALEAQQEVFQYAQVFVSHLCETTLGNLSDLCKADDGQEFATKLLKEVDVQNRQSLFSDSSGSQTSNPTMTRDGKRLSFDRVLAFGPMQFMRNRGRSTARKQPLSKVSPSSAEKVYQTRSTSPIG